MKLIYESMYTYETYLPNPICNSLRFQCKFLFRIIVEMTMGIFK